MSNTLVGNRRQWHIPAGVMRYSEKMTGKAKALSSEFVSVGEVFKNLALLTVGALIYVIGVNGILIPKGFLNGGMVGISLIINYLAPSLNLGVLYLVLNIPLFILGWITVSNRFILYTGFGILMYSFLTELVTVPDIAVQEPLLSAILAGIVCGVGGGLILRSSGSVGGLDILGVHLYKRFSLPLGWTSFMVNSLILTAAAFLFSLEMALYTLVFVFTQSKVVDAVVTGFNKRKSILIVSDKSKEIAEAIMTNLHRGVTFLDGTGAYSGREKKVVFSVVTLTELARMKALVFSRDPQAFVVVNDTLDVLGSSMGHGKVY